MQFYYNPLDKNCKSRTGAFPRGALVTFRIYWAEGGEMPHDLDARFVFWEDGKERTPLSMNRTENGFAVTLRFHQTGLYFYYFRIGDAFFGCGMLFIIAQVDHFLRRNGREGVRGGDDLLCLGAW